MHIKAILLAGFGFIFLGMGAIGLLLPVWPTTPFVLLAAACFSATPRLRAKIMKISFFREYLENYEKRNGLSRKTVILSLSYLWAGLLLSMWMMKNLHGTLMLSLVGIAVTTHILWMARARQDQGEEQ